jgi:hypothetical protein
MCCGGLLGLAQPGPRDGLPAFPPFVPGADRPGRGSSRERSALVAWFTVRSTSSSRYSGPSTCIGCASPRNAYRNTLTATPRPAALMAPDRPNPRQNSPPPSTPSTSSPPARPDSDLAARHPAAFMRCRLCRTYYAVQIMPCVLCRADYERADAPGARAYSWAQGCLA